MRRMYSEKQIKNLIEEDLSDVVVTKGVYTTSAGIKLTRVGHCITIQGFINVNNTSKDTITDGLIIIHPLLTNNIDDDEFNLVQNHNDSFSFATGYVSKFTDDAITLTIENIPTGESTYYLDIDVIDNDYLPVEDYPGE